MKLNKNIKLKTVYRHDLIVCLRMPLQQIQVIGGKAAEGTQKNLSCVGLPDMGITTIL